VEEAERLSRINVGDEEAQGIVRPALEKAR